MTTPRPPEHTEVTRTLDQLHIVFPRQRTLAPSVPTQGSRWWGRLRRPTLWESAWMLAIGYGIAGYAIVMMLQDAHPVPLLAFLPAVINTAVVLVGRLRGRPDGVEAGMEEVVLPRAEVTLTPHMLRITSQGRTAEVLTESIEKITCDKAGARFRSGQRVHYLLPQRSTAEREWLAGVLAERSWQAPSADSEAGRAQLEALLKRPQ